MMTVDYLSHCAITDEGGWLLIRPFRGFLQTQPRQHSCVCGTGHIAYLRQKVRLQVVWRRVSGLRLRWPLVLPLHSGHAVGSRLQRYVPPHTHVHVR